MLEHSSKVLVCIFTRFAIFLIDLSNNLLLPINVFRSNLFSLSDDNLVDERFKSLEENKKPLVILFGWAGANGKHLSKYAEMYRRAGCITLGYNLPTRFIFQITEYTPYLSKRVLEEIENAGVEKRPIFLHIMSDTGISICENSYLLQ